MTDSPTKQVESVLGFFNDAVSKYNAMCELKTWCEDKTQDILHELELVQHTHNERGRLAKELAEVRRKRRDAKDTIEVLDPLIQWVGNHKKEMDALTKVLGEMRRADNRRENRLYYKRAEGNHEIIGGGEAR